MRITAIFLTAASFVSAMSLSADYFHPSARMVYGVNKYRRTVGDNTTYDDIITATQSATAQQAIKDDINNLTATTVALLVGTFVALYFLKAKNRDRDLRRNNSTLSLLSFSSLIIRKLQLLPSLLVGLLFNRFVILFSTLYNKFYSSP
jgi:Na+/H+ antiporter NhaC